MRQTGCGSLSLNCDPSIIQNWLFGGWIFLATEPIDPVADSGCRFTQLTPLLFCSVLFPAQSICIFPSLFSNYVITSTIARKLEHTFIQMISLWKTTAIPGTLAAQQAGKGRAGIPTSVRIRPCSEHLHSTTPLRELMELQFKFAEQLFRGSAAPEILWS